MKDVWTGSLTKPSEKKEASILHKSQNTLLEKIVLASTEEGQVILDPFCGSGTTGVEAVRFGRKFIGIDICQEYLEISKKKIGEGGRWQRDFDEWLSKFRPSISSYNYYIDFEKVVRNVEEIKVELNILNSLIGSKISKKSLKR